MTRQSKFDLRREATRTELLRLGVERFPVKGYSRTTVEDVVRDSGLTRGAFYFHFADKEEFFFALLDHRGFLRGDWWQAAADPAHTTLQTALTAALTELDSRSGAAWVHLFVDFAQTIKESPHHRARFQALYADWVSQLENLVRILVDRGLARSDLGTARLAGIAFAVADGFDVHNTLFSVGSDDLIDTLVRVLRPD